GAAASSRAPTRARLASAIADTPSRLSVRQADTRGRAAGFAAAGAEPPAAAASGWHSRRCPASRRSGTVARPAAGLAALSGGGEAARGGGGRGAGGGEGDGDTAARAPEQPRDFGQAAASFGEPWSISKASISAAGRAALNK